MFQCGQVKRAFGQMACLLKTFPTLFSFFSPAIVPETERRLINVLLGFHGFVLEQDIKCQFNLTVESKIKKNRLAVLTCFFIPSLFLFCKSF